MGKRNTGHRRSWRTAGRRIGTLAPG